MGSNFENFGDTMPELGGFGLSSQSSVYSLTFDEFQNSIGGGFGKDFGSMNMDELLKSIWSAEETQILASSSVGPGPGTGASGVGGCGIGIDLPGGSHLQRQGSITLPRTMSQKTVDEVWRDLYRESEVAKEFGSNNGVVAMESNMPQRQQTLGEMTLEEFLVKAGIVKKDFAQTPQIEKPINNNNGVNSNSTNNDLAFGLPPPIRNNNNNNRIFDNGVIQQINNNNNNNNNNSALNQPPILPLNFGGTRSSQPPPPHQQVFAKLPATTTTTMSFATTTSMHSAGNSQLNSSAARQRNGAMVGLADPTSLVQRRPVVPLPPSMGNNRVTAAAVSPMGHISQDVMIKSDVDSPGSLSPVPYLFSRRGKCGAALEKVIERRQKRMIKNRASAARSRARKQAYTMELEAEVAKLKEINDELQRKQEEIIEMQKNQILEAMNQQWGSKKPCLKRTFTGPW